MKSHVVVLGFGVERVGGRLKGEPQQADQETPGDGERMSLPDGWTQATLGEACTIVLGQSPPSSTYNTEGIGLPFYQGKAEFGDTYPEPVKWCSEPKKVAQAGDILISVRAPVGPTNICREKSCIGRGLSAIRPKGEMPELYFLYFLRSIEQDWERKATGTTFSAITGDVLKEQQVPLAPPQEQRRIVDVIETQFTRLDAALAALERTQANLEHYRASVLQVACEGRLVPTEAELARREGRDYEPADELLERILEERRAKWEEERWEYEIERAKKKAAQAERKAAGLPYYIRDLEPEHWEHRTPEEYEPYLPKGDKWKEKYDEPEPPNTGDMPELPEGWTWASVDQVSVMSQYGTSEKARRDYSGVPVLRMGNIEDGQLSFDDLKYMPADWSYVRRFLLEGGDVLFNRTNSAELVGKTAVYKDHHPESVFASYLIRVRTSPFCLPDYLSFYINSFHGRRYIDSVVSQQVGQANVNATKLSKMTISLPPFGEQRRIVEEVERRLSVVEALQKSVEANLSRAERLRQAILKKAFEGRLSPQNPSDEPASVLLQRIKTGEGDQKGTSARQMKLL
jgi:type I restriction enzyme S subunit